MMSSPPAISVIMPCYNDSARLPQAIDSVAKQSFKDFELIVINDGSTDNTSLVLKRLKASLPFLQVIDQDNQGASAARNHGQSWTPPMTNTRGSYDHE